MTTITIPDELGTQLQALAEETGGTVADMVKQAVASYLAELEEDKQDAAAARLALEEYEREGGGVTLDELAQELKIRT